MNKIKAPFNISSLNYFFDSDAIVNPKSDWNILMVIFTVMLIGSFVFDTFIYTQIINGDMYVSVNKDELTIQSLKKNQVQKLISELQSRETKLTSLKMGSSIDPSL